MTNDVNNNGANDSVALGHGKRCEQKRDNFIKREDFGFKTKVAFVS